MQTLERKGTKKAEIVPHFITDRARKIGHLHNSEGATGRPELRSKSQARRELLLDLKMGLIKPRYSHEILREINSSNLPEISGFWDNVWYLIFCFRGRDYHWEYQERQIEAFI